MRDWSSVTDRRDATIAFADFMNNPKHEALRKECCNDPQLAKRQFATIGQYYLEGEALPGQPANDQKLTPIPKSVEFKVYEAKDPKRHDLAVLVLPSATGKVSQEATDIWIAAWPPWTSLL